jgi:hypothetical protein
MMPDSTRHTRPRRGPLGIALIASAFIVAAWTPSLIATAYAEEPAVDYLANPAAGWAFLWEAVTASRNPRLGTADAAMQVIVSVAADDATAFASVAQGVPIEPLPVVSLPVSALM